MMMIFTRLTRLLSTLICLLFLFANVFAQDATYLNARNTVLSALKKRPIDAAFTQSLDRFYMKSCDSLVKAQVKVDEAPVSGILTRLFEATTKKLSEGKINMLRIPAVNNYFLQTLKTYKSQSILPLYRQFGLSQTAILDYAFNGTTVGDSVANIIGIREMLNAPYLVSTRLSDPKYAQYRDTLLYFMTNTEPELLIKKLEEHDSLFTLLAANTNNNTVRAIAQIPKDNYYDKVLPFALAIQENRTTAEDVRKLTLQPHAYYKAFVDEVIRLHTDRNYQTKTFLQKPIIKLNNTLSNKYYISEVNELHESPDNTRFKIITDRSPRELYFLLTGGTGELYTSSFLYIYKKFIKDTEKQGLENFFGDIGYYQFDQFLSNISGYGLVDDLASRMQEETLSRLISQSISSLSSSQLTDNEIILHAMTLSDVLYSLKDRTELKTVLIKQINNYTNPRVANDILLQRLYTGFKDILLNRNEYKSSKNYDVLQISRLKRDNKISQAVFFYDDDDGTSSFANSTATYASANWDKKDMGNYIVYTSKGGNDMRVFMNKPNTKAGCDTAQDEMLRAMRAEGLEPTSFIHRGHSYYLFQSLRKITPNAQFVFLGSCGGYNEVLELFKMNPDVNIIATRNIGSSQINDPMLKEINSNFINNKDIVWDDAWKNYNAKFQTKNTKDLFSSYIAPNQYVGIKYIRKVFNY